MSFGDKLLADAGFISENQNDPLASADGCLVYSYRGSDETKRNYVLRIGNVAVVMWNGHTSITIPNNLIIPIAIKLHEMHGLPNWENSPTFSRSTIDFLNGSSSSAQDEKVNQFNTIGVGYLKVDNVKEDNKDSDIDNQILYKKLRNLYTEFDKYFGKKTSDKDNSDDTSTDDDSEKSVTPEQHKCCCDDVDDDEKEELDLETEEFSNQYRTTGFNVAVSVPTFFDGENLEHIIHVNSTGLSTSKHMAMLKAAVENIC